MIHVADAAGILLATWIAFLAPVYIARWLGFPRPKPEAAAEDDQATEDIDDQDEDPVSYDGGVRIGPATQATQTPAEEDA